MIDPAEPPERQIARQAKIIDALIRRAERETGVGGSAYSLFQSAIALQGVVWDKTRDLERALDNLGRTASELETARSAREQTQRTLADALTVIEGGFALFTEGTMRVCNDLFRALLPDISERVQPGVTLGEYFALMEESREIDHGDAATMQAIRAAAAAPGTVSSFVFGLKRDRWFQLSRQKTSSNNVVLLHTEITEIVRQNRIEQDNLIDRQAHYLQAAFDEMGNGVCSLNRAGRVLIHNTRFTELLDLPYTLVRKGTPLRRILEHLRRHERLGGGGGDEVESLIEELRNAGELQRRIRTGRERVVEIRVHQMPDRGYLINATDVTLETRATQLLEERVRARTAELTEANLRLRAQHEHQTRVEEALRLAKEQLEGAIRARTRFLAAASHDLLQPINAAKLLVSTLVEGLAETPHADTAQRLRGSFSSMEQLLTSLLDISRLESAETDLTRTDIRLDSLIRTLKRDYGPMAEAKGLRLDIVPSTLWVRSDRRYLLRSLQNLLVNAIQYTERGRVLLGCRRRDGRVFVEVWDTGVGIALRDQKRIFEEFARADSLAPRQGLGLGLSIVDRACRHLGHSVSVRSKPGIGSVFSIGMDTVPPGIEPEESGSGLRPQEDPGLELIVLVVENDAEALVATTRRLEAWGASVLAAASVAEAVGLVDEIGMPPDIILADYRLDRDENGAAAIAEVRRRTGVHVPAIVVTAERGQWLSDLGREQDFAVLTKPVKLSQLRPLIQWQVRQGAAVVGGAPSLDESRA